MKSFSRFMGNVRRKLPPHRVEHNSAPAMTANQSFSCYNTTDLTQTHSNNL